MKKRKSVNRRQSAIRWIVILILTVAYLVLPGRFNFLPFQAIREAERLGNIGSTQLIYEFPGQEGHTLRGNDKALMVCSLRNNVQTYGWTADYRSYLDCSKPAPFYVGFFFCNSGADWYGRIDTPEAESLQLDLYERDELWGSFTLKKEDWIEKDGHFYFALEIENKSWAQYIALCGRLLDSEGNLLASWERERDTTRIGPGSGRVTGMYQ